jgi:dTDP-4-amino-4,6-dideoxygalactose transaminase
LRNIEALRILEHKESERPDYRLVVVRIGDSWPLSRDATLYLLQAENVLARPYYSPLNRRTVSYPRVCPPLPITDQISGKFMVLPSGAHVSEDDVERIVELLANIYRHGAELQGALKAG